MPRTILTRQRTPLDDFPVDAFQDFAEFVRRMAPRWLDGSRSLNRLTMRRARLRCVRSSACGWRAGGSTTGLSGTRTPQRLAGTSLCG